MDHEFRPLRKQDRIIIRTEDGEELLKIQPTVDGGFYISSIGNDVSIVPQSPSQFEVKVERR